jgi:hypothetical protein
MDGITVDGSSLPDPPDMDDLRELAAVFTAADGSTGDPFNQTIREIIKQDDSQSADLTIETEEGNDANEYAPDGPGLHDDLPPPDVVDRDTPDNVSKQLLALRGVTFTDVQSLTRDVRTRSSYSPPQLLGLFGLSMFRADETGAARSVQTYVCTREGCPAHIRYHTADGVIKPHEWQWEHNHDVNDVELRSIQELSAEQRKHIDDLTSMNMTAGQIRIQMGLVVAPQVLYDARRSQLRFFRRDQAERLVEEIEKWDDMTVKVNKDPSGRLKALYCFHTVFEGKEICRQVLILDDTACTNFFGLPLLVVLGVDEYNLSQLIGFALMPDRTVEAFVAFLDWLKPWLGPPGPEHPVPLAFLSDRHGSQLAGLRRVFALSLVIFCAKHLGANIEAALPANSQVREAFWPMMNGEKTESFFLNLIDAELARYKEGSKPWNMLQLLKTSTGHYLPSKCREWTHVRVTSCVEGFFGVLKNMLNHAICTLAMIAKAVRLIGRMWLVNHVKKSLERFEPFLDSGIMASAQQRLLGTSAVAALRAEAAAYESGAVSQPVPRPVDVIARTCCTTARELKLPCRHLMMLRAAENISPLVSSVDVDARYHRLCLSKRVPPPIEFGTAPAPRGEATGGDFTFSNLQSRFESMFGAAERGDQVARNAITDCLTRWTEHLDAIEPPRRAGSRVHDPPAVHHKGQAKVHPSWNSGVRPAGQIRRGAKGQSVRPVDVARKVTRHCGRCRLPGHNVTTCLGDPPS